MKKTLLSVTVIAMSAFTAFSQCTPTLTGPSAAIVPDTIVNLDVAFVGQNYEMVIQVFVPADTLFDLSGQGNPSLIDIDDYTIDGVTGLPAGFSYTTNPVSGVFAGGTGGCLLVTAAGNDITLALVGTHDIVVSVTAHALGGLAAIPVDVTGYVIVIEEPNGILDDIEGSNFAVSQNIPNPVIGESVISYNTTVPTSIEFNVFDILGKTVVKRSLVSKTGINKMILDATAIPVGIYFYSLSNGAQTITKRFVVTK